MLSFPRYPLLNSWIGKALLFGLVAQPICWAGLSGSAQTILPDTTLENPSQVVRNVEIRERRATRIDGGDTRGRNLFHSFATFNIEADQRVYFANPNNIRSIFARVTGGSRSRIDGTLGVTGMANLFLLNPNGILFGPNAELDLRGSFFATTADRFTFPEGGEFSAINPQTAPLLTVSVPIGLQFGAAPGEIRVRSRSNVPSDLGSDLGEDAFEVPAAGGLQVLSHRTLALVGGVVRLEGGVVSVENGRIELGSVMNPGVTNSDSARLNRVEGSWEVGYGGQRPADNFQSIRLSEGAVVRGGGTEGSVIQLRSRNLTLTDAAQIVASRSGNDPEQATRETSATPQVAIRIAVAETLSLRQGARIATLATHDSRGGDLAIRLSEGAVVSGLINLREGSRIETLADSDSSPGNLNIQAQNMNITGRSTEGISSGVFARTEITPPVDEVIDETPDELPDDPDETPDDLDETPDQTPDEPVDDNVDDVTENEDDLSNNELDATSRLRSGGSVNNLNQNAADSTPNNTLAQIEEESGGYLTIAIEQTLRLRDGGEIAVLGQEAQMGDLNLVVGNLQADQSRVWTQVGRGGAITLEAERANLQQSQLSTEQRFAAEEGDDIASLGAANLQLRVRQRLVLREDSEVSTQSAAEGANLRIRSPRLLVSQSRLATQGGTEQGANLSIGAESVRFVNQSDLTTQGGTERGANLSIRAQAIRFTNSNLSLVAGTGGGANVRLEGRDAALRLDAIGSHLSTQSTVEQGANLTIAAGEINLNDSTFTTVSGAAGGANMRLRGSIPVDSPRPSDLMLLMENRSQLETRSAVRGGNILIDARQIRAPLGSDSDIIAHQPAEQGGRITLDLINEDTDLIGFRQGAAVPGNGTNDIDSRAGVAIRELPVTNLPEVELPSEALNASEVIAQGCEPRRPIAESESYFSITGRSGLPLTPYEPISHSGLLSDLRLPTEAATPETATPLVEAQGWQVNRRGAIVLVANPQPCADSDTGLN